MKTLKRSIKLHLLLIKLNYSSHLIDQLSKKPEIKIGKAILLVITSKNEVISQITSVLPRSSFPQ